MRANYKLTITLKNGEKRSFENVKTYEVVQESMFFVKLYGNGGEGDGNYVSSYMSSIYWFPISEIASVEGEELLRFKTKKAKDDFYKTLE